MRKSLYKFVNLRFLKLRHWDGKIKSYLKSGEIVKNWSLPSYNWEKWWECQRLVPFVSLFKLFRKKKNDFFIIYKNSRYKHLAKIKGFYHRALRFLCDDFFYGGSKENGNFYFQNRILFYIERSFGWRYYMRKIFRLYFHLLNFFRFKRYLSLPRSCRIDKVSRLFRYLKKRKGQIFFSNFLCNRLQKLTKERILGRKLRVFLTKSSFKKFNYSFNFYFNKANAKKIRRLKNKTYCKKLKIKRHKILGLSKSIHSFVFTFNEYWSSSNLGLSKTDRENVKIEPRIYLYDLIKENNFFLLAFKFLFTKKIIIMQFNDIKKTYLFNLKNSLLFFKMLENISAYIPNFRYLSEVLGEEKNFLVGSTLFEFHWNILFNRSGRLHPAVFSSVRDNRGDLKKLKLKHNYANHTLNLGDSIPNMVLFKKFLPEYGNFKSTIFITKISMEYYYYKFKKNLLLCNKTAYYKFKFKFIKCLAQIKLDVGAWIRMEIICRFNEILFCFMFSPKKLFYLKILSNFFRKIKNLFNFFLIEFNV